MKTSNQSHCGKPAAGVNIKIKGILALIPLLILLCFSTVGRSGADVGAQTDPPSRGGAREGESLTTGERPLRQREEKKRDTGKDVKGGDITTDGARLALTEEDNELRRTWSDLNIF